MVLTCLKREETKSVEVEGLNFTLTRHHFQHLSVENLSGTSTTIDIELHGLYRGNIKKLKKTRTLSFKATNKQQALVHDASTNDLLLVTITLNAKGKKPVTKYNPETAESTFLDDFGRLLKNQSTADVVFKFPDGNEMKAHQFLLSVRSPIFESMFNVDMQEKQTRTVEIKDASFEAFSAFLEFIYKDHYVQSELTAELFYLADKYQVKSLLAKTANALLKNNQTEAIENLYLFDRHQLPELKQEVVKYIAYNHTEILTDEVKSNLETTHPELFKLISEIIGLQHKFQKLDLKNAIEVLIDADHFKVFDIKRETVKFIANHHRKLLTEEVKSKLRQDHPNLIEDVEMVIAVKSEYYTKLTESRPVKRARYDDSLTEKDEEVGVELDVFKQKEPAPEYLNEKSTFIEDLSRYSKDESTKDVCFRVAGQCIKAHKSVLSVRSSVFGILFNEEPEDYIIKVEDTSVEAFTKFLKFIYEDAYEPGEFEELSKELLALADRYGVESLKEKSIQTLWGSVCKENLIIILALFAKHQVFPLIRELAKTVAFLHKEIYNEEAKLILKDASPFLIELIESLIEAYEY